MDLEDGPNLSKLRKMKRPEKMNKFATTVNPYLIKFLFVANHTFAKNKPEGSHR